MPIRPENKARYPRNWPDISGKVRERAQHRCEWPGCGARNYAIGHWEQRDGVHVWAPHRNAEGLESSARSYAEARQLAAELYFERGEEGKPPTVIVLTVAHLDHVPENCHPSNLRAWCQRHHLAYDAEHHAKTRQASRRAASGQLQLLEA